MEKRVRKLVLENGEVFFGEGFGAKGYAVGEIVFNTSMAGYQEIVSDLGYTDQMIVLSYPIIGSYGVTDEDYESKSLGLKALIVRDYNDCPSNFRYTKTLAELLEENGVPGLQGIDTRKLVGIIRESGSMTAVLCDENYSTEQALIDIKNYVPPTDAVKRASSKKRWYSRTPNHRYNVVAVDCGIMFSMIKELNLRGCNVTVVPHDISSEEVLSLRPDGVYLSNGPGNPKDVPEVIKLVQDLKGKVPMFGVGLGNQIMALALGADTYKMKLGHRGGNHPIKDCASGNIEIAAQNHGYAVDGKSLLKTTLKVSHVDLLDGTVEGVEDQDNAMFAVQFYPDSAPGPNGSMRFFDKFMCSIEERLKDYAEEN